MVKKLFKFHLQLLIMHQFQLQILVLLDYASISASKKKIIAVTLQIPPLFDYASISSFSIPFELALIATLSIHYLPSIVDLVMFLVDCLLPWLSVFSTIFFFSLLFLLSLCMLFSQLSCIIFVQARGHRVMNISPRYDQYKDAWDTCVLVEVIL